MAEVPARDLYDVLIIGSGTAATLVADRLARQSSGRRIGILERGEVGGTCALRGCNPKKAYAELSEATVRLRQLHDDMQLSHPVPLTPADWPVASAWAKHFTDPVPPARRQKYEDLGVELIPHAATMIDPHHLRAGERTLRFASLVIASGSKPMPIPFDGAELVTSSADYLAMTHLPESITFLGGGYISIEFACIAASYGIRCRVVERGSTILDPFDDDLANHLAAELRRRSIAIDVESEVSRISRTDDGQLMVTTTCQNTQSQSTHRTDMVVHGMGRVAAIDQLQLNKVGIESTPKGIRVDKAMRTSLHHIYAAGDCADTGHPQLTPVAEYEADVVADNLLGGDRQLKMPTLPAASFCVPPIASVGLTTRQARDRGEKVQIVHEDLSTKGSIVKFGSRCAAAKFLLDPTGERFLGAHLLGPQAAECIHPFAMAIEHDISVSRFKRSLRVYPSLTDQYASVLP